MYNLTLQIFIILQEKSGTKEENFENGIAIDIKEYQKIFIISSIGQSQSEIPFFNSSKYHLF